MKVSDAIIDYLKFKDITTVFTVSGGGCIHLIDSLRKSDMEVICTHHEQAALMAAEGYYRMSGKMAACVVTTGPGGTNSLTGLLGMWLDSIPCIIISGQVPTNQRSVGTGCRQVGDQEFDIIPVVANMTKYSKIVINPTEILYALNMAILIAKKDRPGPVWLDVPLDVQSTDIAVDECYTGRHYPSTNRACTDEAMSEFYDLLYDSKKPLVVVGNGIRLSNTYDKLNDWLEHTGIPVVTGPHSGVDAVDNTLDHYCGRIGILGQRTSNQIVQQCDLLIVLGSRLTVKMTGYATKLFAPNAKKVFVDIDVAEMNKHSFDIDLKMLGDLNSFFNKQLTILKQPQISEWQSEVKAIRDSQKYIQQKHIDLKGYVSMYYLINKAPDIFKNTPIITSNGSAHVVTLQTYQLNKDQRLFTNVGCASMGYGLPAAIGACIANHRQPVICIEGDGSLMMNLQELQTMKSLPVKLLIVNNNGYASIKMTQQAFFGDVEFASGPENGVTFPSYEKVAFAFDIPYLSIHTNDEIESGLSEMMSTEGPVIVEIFADPLEKHEPKVTHKGIGTDGKIIPGTLTDMT